MSENQNTEVTEKKERLSPKQEADMAIKVATQQAKALTNLVRLDLRNYLAQLAHLSKMRQSGETLRKRKAIEDSLERAIVFALDFGVEVADVELTEKGFLKDQENAFAAHLVRLKESGMLVIADKWSKKEAELASKAEIKEETKTEESTGENNG